MSKFVVFIPSLPPVGINAAYGVGRASITNEGKLKSGRMYKKKEVLAWDEKAIQIIRNRAILDDWKKEEGANYKLEIYWWGRRNDVDSFSKTLMDDVAYGLEFNDNLILSYKIEKLKRFPIGYRPEQEIEFGIEGFIAILKVFEIEMRHIGEFYSD